MKIKEPLSRETAQKVFENHAVFIAGNDVIASITAIELFGTSAVNYVAQYGKAGRESNSYYIGNGKRLTYFYKSGFDMLVTYHNVMLLQWFPKEVEEKTDAEQ